MTPQARRLGVGPGRARGRSTTAALLGRYEGPTSDALVMLHPGSRATLDDWTRLLAGRAAVEATLVRRRVPLGRLLDVLSRALRAYRPQMAERAEARIAGPLRAVSLQRRTERHGDGKRP